MPVGPGLPGTGATDDQPGVASIPLDTEVPEKT
jgi:hypothetical protein